MPSKDNATIPNVVASCAEHDVETVYLTPPPLSEIPTHLPAIGLLEPAFEPNTAHELRAFCPGSRTAIYSTRVDFGTDATIQSLAKMDKHIEAAARLLPAPDWMHVIAFGCTSASVVIGQDRVHEIISNVRPGVPVINPIGAVLSAFKALRVGRVALVTPYPEEVNQHMVSELRNHGVATTNCYSYGLAEGQAILRLPPEAFLEAALASDSDDAEAIFLSCTGIVVSPIVQEVEKRTGKPVITSNQAVAWLCRAIAGLPETPEDIGMLFSHDPPA